MIKTIDAITTIGTKPLLVIVGFLALTNLIGSNLLSTQGQELSSVLSQTYQLKKENTLLENRIAAAVSLAEVEQWAQDNGFVKITETLAISTPPSVALLNR